jgi:hypothetical protein
VCRHLCSSLSIIRNRDVVIWLSWSYAWIYTTVCMIMFFWLRAVFFLLECTIRKLFPRELNVTSVLRHLYFFSSMIKRVPHAALVRCVPMLFNDSAWVWCVRCIQFVLSKRKLVLSWVSPTGGLAKGEHFWRALYIGLWVDWSGSIIGYVWVELGNWASYIQAHLSLFLHWANSIQAWPMYLPERFAFIFFLPPKIQNLYIKTTS